MARTPQQGALGIAGDAVVRGRLVRGLAGVLVVLGVGGAMLLRTQPLGLDVAAVGWVVIAAGAAVASAIPVRVRFGRNVLDVTAIDVAIGAGLWLLPADELVLAVVLGALVQLLVVLRQRGLHLLMNLALVTVHTVLAALVLQWLLDSSPTGEVALGATVLATMAGAVASALVVLLVAVLDEGEGALESTAGLVTANLAVAAAAGATGGLVAEQVASGGTWWLPLLPLVLTLGMASAFAREHSRATGLRGAIDTTRTVHAADGPVEALQIMVREIARHFDATGAELHRLPQGGGSPARFSVGRTDQASEVFRGEADDGEHAQLLPVGLFGRAFVGWGMSIRIAVPDGDVVRLRVLRDRASGRPFTRNDLELFEGMCRAAVISFETSQMHETLARLEELDEMKTAFLTAVSHDLRTPLAVVLGGVLTLAERHRQLSVDQQALLLERMSVQGRRLDQMLLDLLDIDRLQRGVIEPKREELDITAEVTSTVDAVAASTHPVRVSTTPVTGFVDRGHLARIVENLVRNAIKYTPAGTPVWVDVRQDATGAQVIVSDAGPGVPEDQRRAIFGAFVRGDDAHPSPGTGVGLDLVRRLAELHGGRAWVDERPGGGARFWVTLPNSVAAARSTVPA